MIRCVSAAPLPLLLFSECLAKEEEEEEEGGEEGFWVSRGQDVCLIRLELEEIILVLKRDYRFLPGLCM